MREWEPATEAEAAMRDALRVNDQEHYFRLLARTELLLPVSADALAGRTAMGWGTWTTDGRTHVLAFTSPEAMRACLAEHAGSYRKVAFHELAAGWPNLEWWLGVNPGLPIEAYLPAWFVAQVSRGDVRLPGRTLGAHARIERMNALRARATAAVPQGGALPGAERPPRPGREDEPRPGREDEPGGRAAVRGTAAAAGGAGLARAPLRGPGRDAPAGSPARSPADAGSDRDAAEGRPSWDAADGRPSRDADHGRPSRDADHGRPSWDAGEAADRKTSAAGSGPAPLGGRDRTGPPGARTGRGSDLGSAFGSRSARTGEAQKPDAVPGPPSDRGDLRSDNGGLRPGTPDTGRPAPERRLSADEILGLAPPRPDAVPPVGRPYVPAGRPAIPLDDSTSARWPANPAALAPPAVPAPPAGGAPAGSALAGWHTGTGADAPIAAGAPPRPATPSPGGPPTARLDPGDPLDPGGGPDSLGGPDLAPPTEPPLPLSTETAPPSPVSGGRDGHSEHGEVRDHGAAGAGSAAAGPGAGGERPTVQFTPVNRVEESLLAAASEASTDSFLSTLLLARVLVPGPDPGDDAIAQIDKWRTEETDGVPYLVVFTSARLLHEHLGPDAPAAWTRFTQLIKAWPDEELSFAINPGTPVGASLPGGQIVGLASWAAQMGLTDEQREAEPPAEEPEPSRAAAVPAAPAPVMMQKTIPAAQLPYYLERGYDRVSGFVHRASELSHLHTPGELYAALGLGWSGSPFKPDDAEVYVLRWTAYRPDLYRIPYGGQHETAMRAMRGWVIERSPFRGNGFAPSESRDVVAEFKVDSARLPHGAQLWRVGREGEEKLVALLDADGPRWQRVEEAA